MNEPVDFLAEAEKMARRAQIAANVAAIAFAISAATLLINIAGKALGWWR